ncbi:protein adenylyltransferase SelO [Pontibacillus litoralis]|uniref:Protein nucleotidyltransferase YdiU n=1 Tax=Pontibacillus litoralis JSM 072002 TaxID=1385512 RepID=A0A0A5G4L4_9BACI|nr:YdiU family protein [Pontibacillus litoralis]KGX86088.1 hypothetical protein N784_05870 [Pontibacillus litoralis JSM 072002]
MTLSETYWNLEHSYAELPDRFFSHMALNPVPSPQIVLVNKRLADSLRLDVEKLQDVKRVKEFAGNEVPDGGLPIAQAYAGHQFGYFTMLGDGRAVLLGEHVTPDGKRVDVQLKGAGRTLYSRDGDGRATLGPMLREYVISEAMHGLGIPTTRSLAVVTTGERVFREKWLPGAILTRIASSHLRVGTFQYAANWGSKEELQALADYAIRRHDPDIAEDEARYLTFLENVMKRQVDLIVKWQLVGFIHGVMNTDNMTISGETIDYGPCAFMDTFDPETVFSSIDRQGRYAYRNQPPIAGWNLARFAEALLPLIHENQERAIELAEKKLNAFPQLFEEKWLNGMRAKLGLFNEEKEDEKLAKELLGMMHHYGADYTNTFRALTLEAQGKEEMFTSEAFTNWYERWQARRKRQQASAEEANERMRKHNPAIIPRNLYVEEALEKAVEHGDYRVLNRLLDVLADPYAYSEKQKAYAVVPQSNGSYRTFCGT